MLPSVDSWQSGQTYEQFMGRWSRPIAQEFLRWLPVAANKTWLDIGCGTGVLSNSILSTKQPQEVLAIDSSPEFIAFVREVNQDPRCQFEAASAQSLPVESKRFDAAISGLVLNFVPQPGQALAEMRRVTKPGGTVAAYVWDYAEGMQMLRFFWDAAVSLDKNAASLDEGTRFPLCQQGELEKLFQHSGLRDVQSRTIEKPMLFANFEDYWRPFLGGVGPAPTYVNSLSASQQNALREHLRLTLPTAADGTITLSNHAWAVQGVS